MKDVEKRLRELEFIKPDESVMMVRYCDEKCNWKPGYSHEYHGWSGQVIWFLADVYFVDENRRRYIMKCPIDTFGSEAIRHFVDTRVRLSRELREAGVSVPLMKKYDNGTIVYEFIKGQTLSEAIKNHSDKEGLYRAQRMEIAAKIRAMGYSMPDDHDKNYIVTPDDEVFLIDLDLMEQ